MKKTLSLILILLLGAIPASSQLYRYLDTSEGLSSQRIISIEKDSKGYMWFLTQEGVDRYNGKQYVHYKLTYEHKAIQNFPNMNHLHVDRQGNIWVLGKSGYIFKYNAQQDKYDLMLNFADSLQVGQKLPVIYTCMDTDDNIWLCTQNAQYIYQPQNGKLTHLKSPVKEAITYIRQGKGNQYFIGTNKQILQGMLNQHQLTVKADSILSNFHIVQHIYYDKPTESLLIGTMMDGFYLYNLTNRTLENIGNMKDVTMNSVIPTIHSDQEVLIATDGNGVYKLNMVTKKLEPYLSANHHYSNKMNGDIIKDIFQDEEGRLWMAVFPTSVTIYSEKYPSYEWLRNAQENPNSLVNNQITYLLEDSDGDIWVATSNGVCMFDTKKRTWRSMLSTYQQDTHNQNHVFISLCEAEPGVILVGGYMSGMYRINKKDFIPQYFSPQTLGYHDIRPDKYIRSIYRDEEGIVWAGGYYNFKGLNLSTGEIEHYNIDSPITFITSKNEQELWIGTINGLYKFNKANKQILKVNLSSNIKTINTIYQGKGNKTYIGTHGSGMWIYNNNTELLENYTTSNSALICNNIFCILPSNQPGELIVSTENELSCFNIEESIFMNWTKEQGLLTTRFNTAAGVKTSKGVVAFGSGNGLIIIRDSIILPRTFSTRLVLNNFSVQYQNMKPGTENSPLVMPINETESITLSHDQNIFSLEINSINYDCPSRIFYSWKLEGFYDEWTTPGASNLIRYTGLPPGNYTLKVRALLQDDRHTIEERRLQIIITPPFNQTGIAYFLYMLCFLLVVFAVMRYIWIRRNNLISREKIQFFINTAHDIRTPLTLIKGPLDEINRTEKLSEKGQNNLATAIKSTNKLSDLANKLIDFQKEELYTSHVHVHLQELNQYLQELLAEFNHYAEQKNLQLEFEGTDEPFHAWIDINKIDSIIHNLVSNALKYTPEGGRISVKLQSAEKEWILIVSDTGIGISENDQKKMFKHLFRGENAINQRVTGAGIGMLQTFGLVERHFGQISVTSQEKVGTTFTLRFPIDHKKYIRQSQAPDKSWHLSWDHIPFMGNHSTTPQGTAPDTAPSILIVEDNPDLRQFLHQSLAGTYRTSEAENGQEALQQISKEHPDLIISDIMMPVMRGDELCQKLKEDMATSHIPIILLTALGDRESIIRGLNIKADSYVVKPFDLDILKANIASILANKEFLRQRFGQLNYQTEDLPKEVQEVPGLDLDQAFLIKATNLVKKNLDKDFNVDDLCQEMGMSRSSFYNKIKALTDCSPSEFVRQIRMTEACMLLESKKYTIAEISDMLGYGDPKYFTDVFKKHYGTTPSAYMKQEKK